MKQDNAAPQLMADEDLISDRVPEELVRSYRQCEAAELESDLYFETNYPPPATPYRTFGEAIEPGAHVRYEQQLRADEAEDAFWREARALQERAEALKREALS